MSTAKKVQIVGELGSGVSSLIIRLTDDLFHNTFISTLGVDFKTFNGQSSDDRAFLFDIDHSSRRRGVYSTCRQPDMFMICVDVTDSKSLTQGENFLKEIKRYTTAPCVMIATKTSHPNAKHEIIYQLKTLCQKEDLAPPILTDAEKGVGMVELGNMVLPAPKKIVPENDSVITLNKYIKDREREQKNSTSEYKSRWAQFFTPYASATTKISAAKKAIEILNGKSDVKLTEDEMKALTQGRLKENIGKKMEQIIASQEKKNHPSKFI